MGQDKQHMQHEADVGSGEKPASQKDLEREQQSLKDSPATEPLETEPDTTPDAGNRHGGTAQSTPGRMLRSGTHLARILAVPQTDHTFEAQVYVRLTREPEVAETYIPAGTYPTEAEAWAAAEERAQRAFKENEF